MRMIKNKITSYLIIILMFASLFSFMFLVKNIGESAKVLVDDEINSAGNEAKTVARTSDGTLHMVYGKSINDGTYNTIYYANSTNNGDTWMPVEIINTTGEQNQPCIAVDSQDRLFVFWSGYVPATNRKQIRYMYYNDSWSKKYNLTEDDTYHQYAPTVAVDSEDNVHVAWCTETVIGSIKIRYAESNGTLVKASDHKLLRPNAQVLTGFEWTAVPAVGNNHYQNVDESSSDGNTTYVNVSSNKPVADKFDIWALENTGGFAGTILSVTAYYVLWVNGAYNPVDDDIYMLCGNWSSGMTNTIVDPSGTSYAQYSHGYALNPVGGIPWTQNGLNDTQLGIQASMSTGHEVRCTQAYLDVEHTATPSWENVFNISDTDATELDTMVSLVIGNNDTVHLCWSHGYYGYEAGDNPHVQYRYCDDSVWSEIINVTEQNVTGEHCTWIPSMVLDSNDTVYFTWVNVTDTAFGYPAVVQYRTFNGTWSDITDLSEETGESETITSTTMGLSFNASDKIHVIWTLSFENDETNTTIKHRECNFSEWSEEENLTDNTSEEFSPTIIYANHPNISGIRTNIPKSGFAFTYYIAEDPWELYFYKSDDFAWLFLPSPPSLSDETPANNSVGVSRLVFEVTINISDMEGDPFNWAIGGNYIERNSSTGDTGGIKRANVTSPLPYLTHVTWWVNASDDDGYVNETYTFSTEYLHADVVYVDDDFTESSPGWHITIYDSVMDAMTVINESGTIYVNPGTYDGGILINRTVNITGNATAYGMNRDTIIIDGDGTEPVINITADFVNLTYLRIQGGTCGIRLYHVNGTRIVGCNMTGNGQGILFTYSNNSVVTYSNISGNAGWGVNITDPCDGSGSFDNLFYHINFIGNGNNALDEIGNIWNDTYPSGGNYWDDYWYGYDDYSGPGQNIPGSDGFGDQEREIQGRMTRDYYPFMEPWYLGNHPPLMHSPSPGDGTKGISCMNPSVSILVYDSEGDTFNWTIGGKYITKATGVFETDGVKTAAVSVPLSYYALAIWYVNASDGEHYTNATYSYRTEMWQTVQNSNVDDDYTESSQGWHTYNFSTVQEAIDVTKPGGTVHIKPGYYAYTTKIRLNKSVNLLGEDKHTTIIEGPHQELGVRSETLEVSVVTYPWETTEMNNINISNITIKNRCVAPYQSCCIALRKINTSAITNCIITGGYYGIVTSNDCKNILIENCSIYNFDNAGIIFAAINNSSAIHNTINGTTVGIHINGGVQSLDNILLLQNTVRNNIYGVWLVSNTDNCTITENEIVDNTRYGITVDVHCSNNSIYHNNFYDNNIHAKQAEDDSLIGNIWNDTYPSGGNYWSDFDEIGEGARDLFSGAGQNISGSDGIVDGTSPAPYILAGTGGSQDWYPLMYPFGAALRADFSYYPSAPKTMQMIRFTDKSTGYVKSRLWSFGDGTSGSGRTPTHIYMKEGFYTVTLRVTDYGGRISTASKILTVGSGLISIPPLQPPKYPNNPFTVPEMYELMRATVKSSSKVIIVAIDSGNVNQVYHGVDLGNIITISHPSYSDGTDRFGHGTWVGYAVQYGVQEYCPFAVQYSLRAFDESGQCTPEVFLESLDMAKEMKPDIVTISAGIIGTADDEYSRKVNELRSSGIFVTVSAGNEGPGESTVTSPASGEGAVAVGAVDPIQVNGVKSITDLSDDVVCDFSSRGPVERIFPKPDFTAPGESIIGPWALEEKVASGTSMAAPFVASGALQIISANKLWLDWVKLLYGGGTTTVILETSLADSAYEKGDMDAYGWGIPNIQRAVAIAKIKAVFCLVRFLLVVILTIVSLAAIVHWSKKAKKRRQFPILYG